MIDDKLSSLLIKEFFNTTSNRINEICSKKCEINKFEEFICSNTKTNVDISNANINCYENCVSKYYSSSILGVSILHEKII